MTNYNRPVRIFLVFLFALVWVNEGLVAQETGFTISGKVLESGSGLPLPQAVISISATGSSAVSGEDGTFTLELPLPEMSLLVNYPGFHTTKIFTKGQSDIEIYLTRIEYKSDDETYSSTLGQELMKDAVNSVTLITKHTMEGTGSSSFDQSLVGQIPGLQIIENSGMPGHSSWINMRGVSSLFARNEPIVYIDGMIHEINFMNNLLIEGHTQNPLDIVDIEDVVDITALKIGEGHLGGAGSNGALYINTEQKRETSASILIKMYGGIALPPSSLDVLGKSQYESYFNSLLAGEGYSGAQIDNMYPWLNLNAGSEFYRYNNNTDWQKTMFKPSALQKYYIFLKGGDDIATYNISSGFQRHGAPYDQWRASRYNLRLNGKINITNKLTVIPNTKLALSDTYLSNMGPTSVINPVLSSLMKPPLMAPNERSSLDGSILYPFDDIGVFNVSNPAVLISEGMGSDRSFQLLTSVRLEYAFSPNLVLSNVIGTSVSNERVNIFIPDVGVVQLDSAWNSPRDMVTEYRSTQNHTTLTYKNTFDNDHNIRLIGGFRFMNNIYKNNQAFDLNTPSDDFRSLGQGSTYTYLRENGGFSSEMKWLSYFVDANYSFRDKYYLKASMSYDASSVFNAQNRYNFYPSLFGAWRINSEDFFDVAWVDDLKLRASYSITGNMFSTIYEYSKATYTGRRYNNQGVIVRDYNPNVNLEGEKKSTVNAGVDLSVGKKAVNFHADYYISTVNNLVINQLLPYNFGFTDYFNNGGAMSLNGLEFGVDARIYLGQAKLFLDASVTRQSGRVTSLDFINAKTEFLTRDIIGGQIVTAVDGPLNAFYGYVTNGVYNTDEEANGMIGPKGRVMGAGDVIFVDVDGNNIIDDFDKQAIGDPNPDLFGAFSAELAIKRFEIAALFTYSYGNDVFNYVRYQSTSMESYANQSVDVLNRWTPDNVGADMPRASIGDPTGNNEFSDRWIEDGSYLRLRQLRISYRASSLFGLQKEAVLYLTGTNLLTLTGYSGYDPEVMYVNDPLFMGIDYGKLPLAPSVIFGIQLSL